MTLVVLMAMLLLTSACQPRMKAEGAMVAVSLPPQKFFVERIAGDSVAVHVLVPAGANPESYDPSPRDIALLEQSDAYFAVGVLPFELQWISYLEGSEVRVVNIAQLIPDSLLHDANCDHDHIHLHGDPHFWSSFRGGRAMADAFYTQLASLYPQYESHFKKNYLRLLEEISALEAKTAMLFQSENVGKSFVIYHPSLTLFAEEWGLNQLVIEQDGSEPTPRHLVELIDEARRENVRVVFIQEEFEVRQATNIADELGVEPIVIQPTSEDWLSEMELLVSAFAS